MIFPLLFLFAGAKADDMDDSVKRFLDVLNAARQQAADPVSTGSAIYQGAIPAMLRALDPHSVFFDPQQYEQLKHMEQSEQKGFGTVVSVLPGRVIVLQTLPGTPSAKAGLSPGDEILGINNVPLARLEFDQLVEFLGAARQRQARLVVRRQGNARLLEFVLDPALLDAPSVDRAFLLSPGYAYVRAASFDPQTGKLIGQAIEKLGGAALKGLVLDLRNNPGGVVEAAIETASLFLQPGRKILSIKGRGAAAREVEAPKLAAPYSFRVAVLVNEKTASAAEIVSGALQDHDRAVILGQPTYGKGLVQSIYPLSSATAMALTTAFYYTPSGRSIQRPLHGGQLQIEQTAGRFRTDSGREVSGGGGIVPDIVVQPEAPSRLRVALEGSGILTSFATGYLRTHPVTAGFQPSGELLDDFQLYASERGIQPAVAEWLRDRAWTESRLAEEIVTQALGVDQGDRIALRRDLAVESALSEIQR